MQYQPGTWSPSVNGNPDSQMPKPVPSFDELSAFVDGELDGARTAAVAQAVARDPKIARQVEDLAALKDRVGALYPAAPAIALDLQAHERRPKIRIAAAVAAGFAAAVIAGLAVMFGLNTSDARHPTAIDAALALHRSHTATGKAQPIGGHLNIPVPDLSASRLTVARIAMVEMTSGRVAEIDYRGTRGCRISLFVFPSTLDSAALAKAATLPTAAAWNERGRGYLVAATEVGPRRLETIIAAIRFQIRERRPLSDSLRRQLAVARANSAPCHA